MAPTRRTRPSPGPARKCVARSTGPAPTRSPALRRRHDPTTRARLRRMAAPCRADLNPRARARTSAPRTRARPAAPRPVDPRPITERADVLGSVELDPRVWDSTGPCEALAGDRTDVCAEDVEGVGPVRHDSTLPRRTLPRPSGCALLGEAPALGAGASCCVRALIRCWNVADEQERPPSRAARRSTQPSRR